MKQRILLVILISILTLSFMFCGRNDAYVRFANSTDDITVLYGIRLGDAEHRNTLNIGYYTSYHSTDAGTYSVLLRNAGGSWVTDSLGSYTILGGYSYTLFIDGSQASYWYNLVID